MNDEENNGFDLESYYMNLVQIQANLIDANVLFAEWARATGKTEGITTPRIIRVANDMPGELGFLVHSTYTALFTNVWPNIQASFSRPIRGGQRPMLEYGVDYVAFDSFQERFSLAIGIVRSARFRCRAFRSTRLYRGDETQ